MPPNNLRRIAIASDHAGYDLKDFLATHLRDLGYQVQDFGTDSDEAVDYPDFIRPAAESVRDGDNDLAVVLGGSGNGEAIVANKVESIRCAVCWNAQSARLAKEHNNANVIAIGARLITAHTAVDIIDAWLNAEFKGGRHQRRIDAIEL